MLSRRVAYFSMEIGIESSMRTYSGGLGVLAGDTLRSAADLGMPLVAMTMLHRKGYFLQRLDAEGRQSELDAEWPVDELLAEMPERVSVRIEGRTVRLRCWKYQLHGINGHLVPVYFLDADLLENSEWDRSLTDHLYGGDSRYRLAQEVVLGIGGLRMLRAIGYEQIQRFHMNEGHSSLLTLELLKEQLQASGRRVAAQDDIEAVRDRCVFTTHTPVAAGQDRFSKELAHNVLGRNPLFDLHELCCYENQLNLTYVALNFSRYVNGVARKHSEVSRLLFSGHLVDSITNGVHPPTWTSNAFQELFDRHIPEWRLDNSDLRYASGIPLEEVHAAHALSKQELIDEIRRRYDTGFDPDVFTIGFARRATPYKRADLLLEDVQRLQQIAKRTGALQIVYAGKAHPRDEGGKDLIRRIFALKQQLAAPVRLVYLQGHDMDLGRLLTAGSDLWLNTPEPPLEASGTSGMKAALNGVPSLSILDGWWIEGHIEGITGWAIGERSQLASSSASRARDAQSLYQQLEKIMQLYYGEREQYTRIMRNAISLNGSFFNTQRMVEEYAKKAYRLL